jgi:hypothetical protein
MSNAPMDGRGAAEEIRSDQEASFSKPPPDSAQGVTFDAKMRLIWKAWSEPLSFRAKTVFVALLLGHATQRPDDAIRPAKLWRGNSAPVSTP